MPSGAMSSSAMPLSSAAKKIVLPLLAEDDDTRTDTFCSESVPTEQADDQDFDAAAGSDMETEKADSSRLSKAHSCCTKSSGRKPKRLARFLAYNQAKAASAGEVCP